MIKSTSNPKEILNEFQSFYANLYDKKVDHSDENLMESFLSKVDNNTLTDEQRDTLDEKLTISECFAALKKFPEKQSTPETTDLQLTFTSLSGLSLENVSSSV